MFKNKRIVALALFALMLLVPFASAFALPDEMNPIAWPKVDWLDSTEKYDGTQDNALIPNDGFPVGANQVFTEAAAKAKFDPIFDAIADLKSGGGDFNGGDRGELALVNVAKAYAREGDKGTYQAQKAAIVKNLGQAKELEKILSLRVNMANKYTDKQFAEASKGLHVGAWPNWNTQLEPAFKAAREAAVKKLGELSGHITALEHALKNVKVYETLGDLVYVTSGNIMDGNAIEEYFRAAADAFDKMTPEDQAKAGPQLKKVFDIWKGVAEKSKIDAFLASASEALKKVLLVEAPKSLTKDGWKVEEVASAPGALNGADELRIEKNAKGNYVAKLYKAGVEIASKGLVWVYQPTNGVKAKKIKVDGVETTFSVVDGCWKYAAEFKVK